MADWLKPIVRLVVKLLIQLLEHFIGIDIDGDGKTGTTD